MKKKDWIIRFEKVLKKHHKRNINKLANRLYIKCNSVMASMKKRSKKYNVKCSITIEDIRNLLLTKYGTTCKYFPDRKLIYKNIVFDHIVPISKLGKSSKDNVQIISNYGNRIKGSLLESDLYILLEWLDSINIDLKKDILLRLSHGYIKG